MFTNPWYNRGKSQSRRTTMEEEKIDFRKASPETVLAAKKQVIAQYKAGKKPKKIHENVASNT